ncbi:MAG: hypothetical protein DMG97_31605 [Acidobacteria bacterium]|nr:MAG: hypothetical protein DMG97_31605 [Acidobacteriota bacterium]PYV80399.1 MAG: hypothetical protein DMG96_00750 [Acidobacteriota bacterium]
MSQIRPKQGYLRLEEKAYEALRGQILRRDGWRCQACGAMTNLEVHHKRFRSQSGEDTEQNLITLCFDCHAHAHHRTEYLRRSRSERSGRT